MLVKGTSRRNCVELADKFWWHSRVYGTLNLYDIGSIHNSLRINVVRQRNFDQRCSFFVPHYSYDCLVWVVLHPDI